MIYKSLEEASYMFTHTDGHASKKSMKIAQNAYAFICSSSLDMTIRNYTIDLDPNRLRDEFKRIFHIA